MVAPSSLQAALDLSGPHRITVKAQVRGGGQVLADLTPTDGQVQADSSNAVLRRCSVSLADPGSVLTPATASSLLTPYGNELHLFRGVIRSDTMQEENYPLGVFGIADVQVDDQGGNLTIRVEGFDRSRRVARASLADVYQIAAGVNYGTAIRDLINSRVPNLVYAFTPTTAVTPKIVFDAGTDPWDAATKMANNLGMDLYFDAAGVCVMRPTPDPRTATTVRQFTEGNGNTAVALSKRIVNEQTYNSVVVTGESADSTPPVRAVARDATTTSPTYYLGPYGEVVRFYSSQFITTTAQAQAAANALLERSLGLTEQATITAIPDPRIEPGDAVSVYRLRSRMDAVYIVDAVTIPLAPDATMSLTTRRRRV